MTKKFDNNVRRASTSVVTAREGTNSDGSQGRNLAWPYQVNREHFKENPETGAWQPVREPQIWVVYTPSKASMKDIPVTGSFDNRELPMPQAGVSLDDQRRRYNELLGGRDPKAHVDATVQEFVELQVRTENLVRTQQTQAKQITDLQELLGGAKGLNPAPGPSAS